MAALKWKHSLSFLIMFSPLAHHDNHHQWLKKARSFFEHYLQNISRLLIFWNLNGNLGSPASSLFSLRLNNFLAALLTSTTSQHYVLCVLCVILILQSCDRSLLTSYPRTVYSRGVTEPLCYRAARPAA